MASFDVIEQDIVNRLAPMAGVPGVQVVLLPETQGEYERPFEGLRITVGYVMSDFGENGNLKATDMVVQEEDIKMEVIVVARKLRGGGGLHEALSVVRKYLVGFEPTDCNKMYLIKNGFKEYDEKTALWKYSMWFCAPSLVVEDAALPDGPTLQQLLFLDQNGGPL